MLTNLFFIVSCYKIHSLGIFILRYAQNVLPAENM